MHWTLQAMLWLCAACALLNVAQYHFTRTIRPIGLLICGLWLVQEAWWWATRADSLVLFVICDALLVLWFLIPRRPFTLTERLIALTVPFTTGLGVFEWLNLGHTPLSWWLNWWIVAAQMMLGLPRPGRQWIAGTVTHGPREGVGNVRGA